MQHDPDLERIRVAHRRIAPYIHRTPVLTCSAVDEMVGARLFFKCENFQKAGAFKSRGACNAVMSLDEVQASRGVATHSSGNHAAALARAARLRGVPAHIVMPTTAPDVKRAAVRRYGGTITCCAPTLQDREATATQVVERTGATLIHPYDNEHVIAGQGTAALELIEEVDALDLILTPLGGGGLLSGTLIAVKALRPRVLVVGVEPANADDAFLSLQAGRIVPAKPPNSIADGLLTSLGEKTFPIIRDLVDQIALAEEEHIIIALRTVLECMKIVVEPSAVVPLAAILAGNIGVAGKRVGIILSGGNLDLARLPGYSAER